MGFGLPVFSFATMARGIWLTPVFVSMAAGVLASPAEAQSPQAPSLLAPSLLAPSLVTPGDIAPASPLTSGPFLRRPVAPPPPAPAESSLAIDMGDVRIEGMFPEMAAANEAFIGSIAHRHVTLAQLYEAAHTLEQAYARRGYILARVVVPPQRLAPGGLVRVVVVDGFIEELDLSHLAPPLRALVGARLQPLAGCRHVTQAAIERALLLAGNLAGAHLRSAIAPGSITGGVRLVVEGGFRRVDSQIGTDNSLPASLGQWQVTGNLALNNPLGIGDQLYLSTGTQTEIGRYGFPRSPLTMLGAGDVLPLGHGGMTLTGEYLSSRVQPGAMAGAPQSVGNYTRGLVRLSVPAILTRRETLNFTTSAEMITQSETLSAFGVQVSRDHYLVWRLGVNGQGDFAAVPVTIDAVLSRGLAGRDGTLTLPVSRQGASPHFTNLKATVQVTLPGPDGCALDLTARGKTGFGKPQFVSEQFALDAENAVSAFPGGSLDVDAGVTLRAELRAPPLVLWRSASIVPYLFGAGGWGWVVRPTAVEQAGSGYYAAGAAGLGGRVVLSSLPFLKGSSMIIGLEFGYGFSNVAGLKGGEQTNVRVGVWF